jgi:hypothetical protein
MAKQRKKKKVTVPTSTARPAAGRRPIRSVFFTVGVCLLGCILIILVAPCVKLYYVQEAMNDAAADLRAGRPERALERLLRVEPWAVRYPSVAQRQACEIVRCYVRMGEIGIAQEEARYMYTHNPGRAADLSYGGLLSYAERGPDQALNAMVRASEGRTFGWYPRGGVNVILAELEAAGDFAELEVYARKVLREDPENSEARDVIEYLTMPVSERPSRVRWGEVFVSVEPEAHAVSRREQRRQELIARRDELTEKVRKRREYLEDNRPAPTRAEREYRQALREHNEAKAKAQSLQDQWEKAEGPRRQWLMDELRKMKGEIARREAAVKQAKARLDAEGGGYSIEKDPEFRSLKRELALVKEELADM